VHYGDFECPFSRARRTGNESARGAFDGNCESSFAIFLSPPSIRTLNRQPKRRKQLRAQGKFWEMAEVLFANQHRLADPYLTRYAMELGMDAAKFDYDLATHAHTERIRADVLSGQQSGVTGTPDVLHQRTALRGVRRFARV